MTMTTDNNCCLSQKIFVCVRKYLSFQTCRRCYSRSWWSILLSVVIFIEIKWLNMSLKNSETVGFKNSFINCIWYEIILLQKYPWMHARCHKIHWHKYDNQSPNFMKWPIRQSRSYLGQLSVSDARPSDTVTLHYLCQCQKLDHGQYHHHHHPCLLPVRCRTGRIFLLSSKCRGWKIFDNKTSQQICALFSKAKCMHIFNWQMFQ